MLCEVCAQCARALQCTQKAHSDKPSAGGRDLFLNVTDLYPAWNLSCVCVCVCVCLVVSMRPHPKDQAYVPSGLINPRPTPPRRSTGLPRSRDRFRKRTGGLCTWATLRRLARTHISGHHKRVRVRGCAWLRVRACVRACAPVCLRLNGVRACVFARARCEGGAQKESPHFKECPWRVPLSQQSKCPPPFSHRECLLEALS
jgi:hypothetical protein